GEPIKLPENLESLPRADHFPSQRHRWNTNEQETKTKDPDYPVIYLRKMPPYIKSGTLTLPTGSDMSTIYV
uniref:Uncharacterized protein n=1 Tax=Megaselia scalaris TaxID=36166 RepID=T1GQ15_MEGSC